MSSDRTARTALRLATADHHHRVDRTFSHADLTDRDGYGRFLLAQAGAYLPVEAALTRAGADGVVPDWSSRRRAAKLTADLRALGLAPPEDAAPLAFEGTSAVLGGIYVLEGSRLGGAMLARGIPAGFPRAFLAPGDSAAWRRLLDILEARLVSNDQRNVAIESASRVFRIFEDSGRRYLKAE